MRKRKEKQVDQVEEFFNPAVGPSKRARRKEDRGKQMVIPRHQENPRGNPPAESVNPRAAESAIPKNVRGNQQIRYENPQEPRRQQAEREVPRRQEIQGNRQPIKPRGKEQAGFISNRNGTRPQPNGANSNPQTITISDDDPEEAYYDRCVHGLSIEFPRATMPCIRRALKCHDKKLEPAYKALYHEYQRALSREQNKTIPIDLQKADWLPLEGFRLNKCARATAEPKWQPCPTFNREFAAVKSRFSQLTDAVSQDIECGCCFTECSFERLVQCADGHLFCFDCLKRHVEESTFGGGQAHTYLPCMDTDGCTEHFPWSEVSRALPADVLAKYERRLAEDSVARARLEGLVYCPFCNFPCEVDPGFIVLDCPNTECRKSSCLKCKEPNHLPLQCHEVEKKSETSLRRHVEELMTKAIIRECIACKAELVKLDGCNKITCRCGQTMCYVCRTGIPPNYTHFCQHVREPGKKCNQCKCCGLWEQEESDAVVQKAKEAAMQEVAREEPGIVNRKIGPEEQQQQQQQQPPQPRYNHRRRGGRRAIPPPVGHHVMYPDPFLRLA